MIKHSKVNEIFGWTFLVASFISIAAFNGPETPMFFVVLSKLMFIHRDIAEIQGQ